MNREIRVEPATIAQGIAIALSIASKLKELSEGGETGAALKEISQKLDILFSLQLRILAEIEKLREKWVLDIKTGFANDLTYHLAAHIDVYTDLVDGIVDDSKLPKETQAVLEQTLIDARLISYRLLKYGIAAHQGALASMYFVHALFLALDKTETHDVQLRSYLSRFRSAFDNWLDPDQPDTISNARIQTESELSEMRAKIDQFPRETVLSERTTRHGGIKNGWTVCLYRTYLTISGNIENGFTGKTNERKIECWHEPGAAPPLEVKEDADFERVLLEIADERYQIISRMLESNSIERTVASSISRSSQLDTINSMRDAFMELASRLAILERIEKQLQGAVEFTKHVSP